MNGWFWMASLTFSTMGLSSPRIRIKSPTPAHHTKLLPYWLNRGRRSPPRWEHPRRSLWPAGSLRCSRWLRTTTPAAAGVVAAAAAVVGPASPCRPAVASVPRRASPHQSGTATRLVAHRTASHPAPKCLEEEEGGRG